MSFLSHVELNLPTTSEEEEKEKPVSEKFRNERNTAKEFFQDKKFIEAIEIYSNCIYEYEKLIEYYKLSKVLIPTFLESEKSY